MRNRYDIVGNKVVIYLNRRDGTTLETTINLEDLPTVQQATSLYADKKRRTFYVVCNMGKVDGKQKKVLLHRLLMNPTDGFEVDHRNGNGLDNERSNLRIADHRTNQLNRYSHKRKSSTGHKHIYWFEPTGKYKVQVTVNKRYVHVGYRSTIEEAIELRDRYLKSLDEQKTGGYKHESASLPQS